MSKLTWACVTFLVLMLGGCFVFGTCTYTVDEREAALVTLFGKVKKEEVNPGLHFKNPMASVTKISTYMQEYNTIPSPTVTEDKKNILNCEEA